MADCFAIQMLCYYACAIKQNIIPWATFLHITSTGVSLAFFYCFLIVLTEWWLYSFTSRTLYWLLNALFCWMERENTHWLQWTSSLKFVYHRHGFCLCMNVMYFSFIQSNVKGNKMISSIFFLPWTHLFCFFLSRKLMNCEICVSRRKLSWRFHYSFP